MTAIADYIDNINRRFQTGISTEHSYRGDLQSLLETLLTDIIVTNEPARIRCGAPDYILTKNDIPLGYIEAKDIGKSLDSKDYIEQFNRYKQSLDNLIITDYLEFRFYLEGELKTTIQLAEIAGNELQARPEEFQLFADLINNFATHIGQNIKSPSKLAKMMAGKAKLLANIIDQALTADEQDEIGSTLNDQLTAFKNILIHDTTAKQFADVYAQTIAYGMFAARLHDETLKTFTRQEAAEKIPKSNPFLRKLFQYIAGYDLDDRISWVIDSLADVFRATDVRSILKNFGKSTRQHDPIIHFYETFLAEYDPKLRKSRGVWYTPEPVVNFIVRAVDDILKSDFGLKDGLADTSKTTIEVDSPVLVGRGKNKASKMEKRAKEVHKVQILDPATGTGTFLAEVIKHIHDSQFQSMQGAWSQYVEEDLIPRVNGFEILMASYAMAHLKLELLLDETGYKPNKNPRLNIYLTNSLEESHPDTGTLFANWLSNEVSEANHIKRDTPVMVVMGNPPYSVSSSNKGDWIQQLLVDYKKDLNERKINLDDDYIKFIRYGQHFVEQNGEGIVAYISNNSFIDGITHRQMRKHLLETFDKIYILDLHGNNKKKETAPDGSKDDNVFDIMQGVSINILVKTGAKKPSSLAEVYHHDLFGVRKGKYQILLDGSVKSIPWQQVIYREPEYFFVPKNFKKLDDYRAGFSIPDLFKEYNSGIQTKRDKICISFTDQELLEIRKNFLLHESETIRKLYDLPADGRDWKIEWAKSDIQKSKNPVEILYRPFDVRKTFFTGNSKGFVAYPRTKIMEHLLLRENLGLIFERSSVLKTYSNFFISESLVDLHVLDTAFANGYIAPLYIYPEEDKQISNAEISARIPNLDAEIVEQIAQQLGLTFTPEKQDDSNSFAPIDLLDYIYAVLHSSRYRDTYKEFLKIDFPRVPYPSIDNFWQLVELGGQLRQLHLLDSPLLNQTIASYPETGDNLISRKLTKTSLGYEAVDEQTGRVWINDQQYFDNVPLKAWEFYIGGYQPAQKWLKDRHGRTLDRDDIRHYLNIITALVETDRLMQEIDLVFKI